MSTTFSLRGHLGPAVDPTNVERQGERFGGLGRFGEDYTLILKHVYDSSGGAKWVYTKGTCCRGNGTEGKRNRCEMYVEDEGDVKSCMTRGRVSACV